jgi:hypothetical protein
MPGVGAGRGSAASLRELRQGGYMRREVIRLSHECEPENRARRADELERARVDFAEDARQLRMPGQAQRAAHAGSLG